MNCCLKFRHLLFLIFPTTLYPSEDYQRIVSLSGSITEIIYALGQEGKLVGRDSSSYYPPAALQLPDVGYKRSLSFKKIVSLKPDLVIGTEDSGPPEVLEKLRKHGIRLEIIPVDELLLLGFSTRLDKAIEELQKSIFQRIQK